MIGQGVPWPALGRPRLGPEECPVPRSPTLATLGPRCHFPAGRPDLGMVTRRPTRCIGRHCSSTPSPSPLSRPRLHPSSNASAANTAATSPHTSRRTPWWPHASDGVQQHGPWPRPPRSGRAVAPAPMHGWVGRLRADSCGFGAASGSRGAVCFGQLGWRCRGSRRRAAGHGPCLDGSVGTGLGSGSAGAVFDP